MYTFYSKVTPEFYNENEFLLVQVAKTLDVKEQSDNKYWKMCQSDND